MIRGGLRALLALLALAACEAVEPAGPCEGALVGDSGVEIGTLTGGDYQPLAPGDDLAVHAGIEGGFHSDLALRLSGLGADTPRAGGLRVDIDLDGGWQEGADLDLSPICHDGDDPALLHTGRYRYLGPGCGEDPCAGPDDPSAACLEHQDCLEREDLGLPNVDWAGIYGRDADVEVRVSGVGFEASARVPALSLVQGFQVSGGG